MPTYDLQFVDSIAASPAVRLDLKGPGWKVRDGTEFPPPPLKRAVTSTLLTDGDNFPAAAYGSRLLKVVVRVDGTDDAIAAQLQLLYRELNRPTNILLYRPGTSAPVFFRTFRAGPDSVTWNPFAKEITAQIPAEPFALGLKETVGPTTVTNNPAAGSNGMFLDLAGIKGDVETPLKITIPYSGTSSTWIFAVRRRGTPSSAPFALQAEAMTSGTDTSTQPNDAAMSGSGNNFSRTTFASNAGMAQRLSTSWPPPGVDVRGRYRVFVLARRSSGTGVINARLGWGPRGSSPAVFGDPVSVATINPAVFDLGLVSFPAGADPVTDGYSGTVLSVMDQNVALWAERVSGISTVDWDYLLFVPADDRLTVVTRPLGIAAYIATGNGEKFVIDGTTEKSYAAWGTGEVYGGWAGPVYSGKVVGGWPAVSPGVTNRLYVVQTASPVSPTTTAQVTCEYWPRYLYARPASS